MAVFKVPGGSVQETDRDLEQPFRQFMEQLGAEPCSGCLKATSSKLTQPTYGVGGCERHAVCCAELAVIPRYQGALWTVTMLSLPLSHGDVTLQAAHERVAVHLRLRPDAGGGTGGRQPRSPPKPLGE